MIFGKLEVRLRLPGIVVRPQAQIFVELVRVDHFAGIHLPVGIPGGLEFAERLHQLGAEHFGEEFGAGLSVAVFAGERTAVADDQVGGFFDELAEFRDALFRVQIEVYARVHAGVSEVAVERAFVAEVGHHLAQFAQIAAQLFRSDGGVFPSFPVERFAGNVRGCAQARFADFPDCACALRRRTSLTLRRSGDCG